MHYDDVADPAGRRRLPPFAPLPGSRTTAPTVPARGPAGDTGETAVVGVTR